MRMNFLDWAPRLNDYVLDGMKTIYWDERESPLPMFYKPKKKNSKVVLKWAQDHALNQGYGHLLPFIEEIFARYVKTRW